jgi:hypothetical protein
VAALNGGLSNRNGKSNWAKMAAAEGSAGDGELWQTWLPNHVVFLRLQEGLKNQNPTEAEKPASSSLPSPPPLPPQLLMRNLVFGLGGELFLWDGESSSFLVVRLRGLGGEEPALSQYQVRPGPVGRASSSLLPIWCAWGQVLGSVPPGVESAVLPVLLTRAVREDAEDRGPIGNCFGDG